MNKKCTNKGFTLIESIIAISAILAIVAGGFVFNEALRSNMRQVERRFDAITTASAQIEDLRDIAILSWADARLSDTGTGFAPATAQVSVQPGNTLMYSVTDMFDWPQDGIGTAMSPDPTCDYKIVNVIVTYPDGDVTVTAYLVQP